MRTYEINMMKKIILVFFFNFSLLNRSETFVLKKNQELMVTDLIKNLKIKHCILFGDKGLATENLSIYRVLSSLKTSFVYKWEGRDLSITIRENIYKVPDTLIIIKMQNLAQLNLLRLVYKYVRSSQYMSRFTWLYFTNTPKSAQVPLLPHYDCKFITVREYNTSSLWLTTTIFLETNQITRLYGTWDSTRGLNISEIDFLSGVTDMKQSRFLAHASECQQGKSFFTGEYDHLCRMAVFYRDLIKMMNFTYTERVISGLERALMEGVMDPVAVFRSNAHQYPYVVKHFRLAKFMMLVRYPKVENTPDYYTRPFKPGLWIAIGVTVIAGGIISVVIHYVQSIVKKKGLGFSYSDYFFAAFESLCNQGQEVSRDDIYRICAVMFRFVAFFVIPCFSADLTAYLSIQSVKLPFQNLEEFLVNGKYKMLIPDKVTYIYRYFEVTNTSIINRVKENFTEYYDISEFKDVFEQICSDRKIAIPFFSNMILPKVNCRLTVVPQPIDYALYTLPLGEESKPFPYHKLIDYKFHRASESGLIRKFESAASLKTILEEEEKSDFQPVEIDQTIHLVSFVAVGIIISLIILCCELLCKKITRILKQKTKKQSVLFNAITNKTGIVLRQRM